MSTPAHLAHVQLHEYSENVPRLHVENHDGTCGALPAKAFRDRYTRGCWREAGHPGAHSGEYAAAVRADRAAARRAAPDPAAALDDAAGTGAWAA